MPFLLTKDNQKIKVTTLVWNRLKKFPSDLEEVPTIYSAEDLKLFVKFCLRNTVGRPEKTEDMAANLLKVVEMAIYFGYKEARNIAALQLRNLLRKPIIRKECPQRYRMILH